MIHYNNDNNAYCPAVNDQKFKTREHNSEPAGRSSIGYT